MRINKDTPVIYLSTSRAWNPPWKMYKGASELGSLQCIIIWSCQKALCQWLGDLVILWRSYNSFRGFKSSGSKHMQNRVWLMPNTLYNKQKTAAFPWFMRCSFLRHSITHFALPPHQVKRSLVSPPRSPAITNLDNWNWAAAFQIPVWE